MLELLNINDFSKNLIPVTSADIITRKNEFNIDGLFSEKIFGPVGSTDRRKSFSFIELHCYLIHPHMYRILLRLDKRLKRFIAAEENFTIDSKGQLIIDPENGYTGLSKFIEIFPQIKFRGDTDVRRRFIKLLKKSYEEKTLFIDKIPVIPPDLRPAYLDLSGNWVIDSLNDIYQGIIRKSTQIRSAGKSGVLFDLLSYSLQLAILEHDRFIKTRVEKKHGLIRQFMLGKRIDFSGRGVITPGPDLKINEIGIPLRTALTLFEPFIIHILLFTNIIDKNELQEELRNFLNIDLSADNIRRIIKNIRTGDEIPKKLYDIFWRACEIAMKDRKILAKRDPSLHRDSIRGFKPILIPGNSIQMSTTTVGIFNCDFDGDTMLSLIRILMDGEKEQIINIKDLEFSGYFELKEIKKYKQNHKIVTKFRPLKDIFIKSINTKTGEINNKKITEYSKHENIKMYKINDPKNRFEDFWSSYDHSLIVYDENIDKIIKISPRELIENPTGKYLIKEIIEKEN